MPLKVLQYCIYVRLVQLTSVVEKRVCEEAQEGRSLIVYHKVLPCSLSAWRKDNMDPLPKIDRLA